MHASIPESKLALRREMRERLAKLTEPQRAAASARARKLLTEQTIWQKANSILFYAPMPEELDVWPLIGEWLAADKLAALPRYDASGKKYVAARITDLARDIKPGKFGIREAHDHCAPIPFDQLDLVLVP